MRAYIYQAALLCEECGETTRELLAKRGKAPRGPNDEGSYDSDRFPKGPFGNGGGEADFPQHCDHCGVFLENPLTNDGVEYVREKVEEAVRAACRQSEATALTSWAPFYRAEFPLYEF